MRPGRRGVPRLYSWVDYLRLQLASELTASGVRTARIRTVVHFLDERMPSWYLLPVAFETDRRSHVQVAAPDLHSRFIASEAGQHLMELDFPVSDDEQGSTIAVLSKIAVRGSLGRLEDFRGDVFMDPSMNLGRPTVLETSLETKFLAGTAADLGFSEAATVYRLTEHRVERAVSFESRVA